MEPKPLERKLTAILYADVAGYSRLTGEDEEGTHHRLSAYLDAITTSVEKHNGKVLHFAGDAVLSDFATVSDALICAAAIQRDLTGRNRDLPEERKVQFRIGVNLGEVIVDRNEIYGDGVNVAARLESLAAPGGICISESVHTAVGNKLPLDYAFLGEQSVKNIAKPVRAYSAKLKPGAVLPVPSVRAKPRPPMRHVIAATAVAVVLVIGGGVVTWLKPWQLTTKLASVERMAFPLPDKLSIAVLPFQNLSDDPEQEYFSDGVTNDIITDLSKFSNLFVIASNSVFTYKGQPTKVRDVGRELGVRYVLEGSIQRAGQRVRINAQLIDAGTGGHLWAERYDRHLDDIFALQDEVTQKIVSALEIKLTATERQRLGRKYTDSVDAYDYLLRGREHFTRRSKEGALSAQEFFQKAIDLDSSFAEAYAMLAWTHARMFFDAWSDSPERSLEQAQELAKRAIAVDSSLPLGYFVMGLVQLFGKEHAKAIVEAEKAIALDPNYANAYALLAQSLNYAGKPKDGLEVIEKALRLSPHHPLGYLTVLGQAYFTMGRYDEAIDAFNRAVERNPDAQRQHMWLAASHAHRGRMDDAEWEVDQLLTLDPNLSLQRLAQAVPYKDPAHLERLLDGLRKAGLPD